MTLKTTFLVIASLGSIVLSACSSSENLDVNMKEGRWEVTTKMEMANLPFSIPPMIHTMCLTKGDIIPQQGNQGEGDNCNITSKKIDGNTVSWTVVCNSNEGKTTSAGSITYNGDSFEGKINIALPGTAESMSQSMTGRWVDDCK